MENTVESSGDVGGEGLTEIRQLCADIQSTPKSKLQWTLFKHSRGRVVTAR